MENLLRDGDYVPNGFGGFTRLHGTQEVLAKALFKLTCRRGSFPFLQDLGSRLYELGRLRPSEREAAAKIYCEQAYGGRCEADAAAERAGERGGLAHVSG